ncbi:MAG: D-tagaturonate epimerase UxaE [Acidobacteriota bacterium]
MTDQTIETLLATGYLRSLYPRSVWPMDGGTLFMFRDSRGRRLGLITQGPPRKPWRDLDWTEQQELPDGKRLWAGVVNRTNGQALRELIDWCRPGVVGHADSFGFGDRLGLANPAHLRAVVGYRLRPVLAQQSVRELERTEREPEDVLDAATAAVLQEGWRDGYGADADHLKTAADVRRFARAGYTMFTFDPGEWVDHEADSLSGAAARERVAGLPAEVLEGGVDDFVSRWTGSEIPLAGGDRLRPSVEEVLRAAAKYGRVVLHARRLHDELLRLRPEGKFEVELSVDETHSTTSVFEHYWLVERLVRWGIRLASLAPRFPGSLEKGIDFRGDLSRFARDWSRHAAVAATLGPYKLSLHSGSDKFSLYPIMARHPAAFHVKTAGTSYLEALRAVCRLDPALFGEILEFSREVYEDARRTYHVSAELSQVPAPGERASRAELLDDDATRQVLHVAFGAVLTARLPDGSWRFRSRLLTLLDEHEEVHSDCLQVRFRRHLDGLSRDGAHGESSRRR